MVLFGPSGCGKTTVLRCLAGLERPEQGSIQFGGETWFDAGSGISHTPQERDVGFFFQSYALFPHRTVAQNIGYGLARIAAEERQKRVAELVSAFGLKGLEERYPHEISGGQQQRVALARALARRPKLLLLDEPLSALDASLRDELREELRKRLLEFGIPTILVTHDRTEAMSLADRIVVMQDGSVLQSGAVKDVFNRPANIAVARSIGFENVLPLRTIAGSTSSATNNNEHVCIAAGDVILSRSQPADSAAGFSWSGQIVSVAQEGALLRVMLNCGFRLIALIPRRDADQLSLRAGETLFASVASSDVRIVRS
jgi:molybdate transport system ATP-binding protein